jgi:hypothetical protein
MKRTNPGSSAEHQDDRRIAAMVSETQRRLNRARLVQAMVWVGAATAAGLLIAALVWVIAGHRVPPWLYGMALLLGAAVAIGVWAARRWDRQAAARYLDDHFNLQDAVTSSTDFATAGQRGGFFDLQRRWTDRKLRDVDLSQVRYAPPRRLVIAGAIALLAAVALGFKPASPEVIAREAAAQHTEQMSTELKEDLQEHIEEMLKQLDEREREAIEAEKLRQWVRQLEATRDMKDLMRQYAQLEAKLARASAQLDRREAERLLDSAAQQLQDNPSSRPLAETLKHKRYADAAKQLDKLRPSAGGKLNEHRQQLDRLAQTSSRLAQSARQFQSSDGSAGAMAQDMQQLHESVQDYDRQLAMMERKRELSEQDQQKLSQCNSGACQQMSALNERLARLAAARKAQQQLQSLRRTLSQCQSAAAGQCQSPFAQKKAGLGTDRSVNVEVAPEEGQLTQIEGQKGLGPSQITTEEADSGTGVATRVAADPPAQFERQLESFVAREDVPEAVKGGVREYFQSIHQLPEEGESR